MGEVGYDSGCDDEIIKSKIPLYVFIFALITGFLSELKIVTSFFLKIAEQSQSKGCNIDRRLELFRFGYEWDCVDGDGKVRRGKYPLSVG